MKRIVQLTALLAGAALFAILPVSELSAQSLPAYVPSSGAHVSLQVQEYLDKGDALAAEGRYGAARREYRAAAELLRAEGRLPSKPLRRIANTYYYQDRYQSAGRILEQLAKEAAACGERKCQVWAVADAAWVAGIAGDKIDMERRLARLERLLTSPYLPLVVREEVTNKRLTAIEANRKLAMIPEVP
jgi:tetratricopeptide (TPR) repeat protein